MKPVTPRKEEEVARSHDYSRMQIQSQGSGNKVPLYSNFNKNENISPDAEPQKAVRPTYTSYRKG